MENYRQKNKMMHEEILEDAQKIKRHLVALGENVDLQAIYELLQNSGPDYKLEHIINMITENWNSGYQNNLDEKEVSIIDLSTITDEPGIHHSSNQVPKTENIQDEYTETSDASSDYDDRDDYYASTNWDDISVVDTVRRPTSLPLEPCDIASSSNHNSEVIPSDVDFLEENNNDPNNNLGFLLQEFQETSSDINHERKDSNIESCVKVIEKPDSPKPGCSKDSHDMFIPHKYSKLHIEAEQINALLPRLKHNIIYKTLLRNSNTRNRIELTLWDLLPEKRPKPQISSKRKLLDDICSMEDKKNIADMFEDDTEITENPHSPHKKHPHIKKRISDQVITESDEIVNTSQQSAVPKTKTNLSKIDRSDNNTDICNVSDKDKPVLQINTITKESQLITESSIVPYKAGTDKTAPRNHSTIILRPSKLTLTSKNATLKSSLVPTPILSPPKFKITKNNKQTFMQDAIIPNQNPRKSAILKPNVEEHVTLDTPTNRENIQTSNTNTVQLQSLVDLTKGNTTILQDEITPNVKTERTNLSENNPSHSSQSCSTKDIHILSTVEDNNSEVKDLKQEGDDINTFQVCSKKHEE